jgi:hypothetical protein
MTLEGNRLIKKTTVTKASSQNFKGIVACARRVSPSSLCGGVFVPWNRFADVHEGMRHGVKSPCL